MQRGNLFRSIPLVGRLIDVPSPALQEAIQETFITTIFAAMPFWLVRIGQIFLKDYLPLHEFFDRGEGLIYSAVLAGPLIFVILKGYGKFNTKPPGERSLLPGLTVSFQFPSGGLFLTIVCVTCLTCGFGFAVTQSFALQSISQDGVREASWFLMILTTIIFFLVTAYSNMLESLESAGIITDHQKIEENQFYDKWVKGKQ